MKRTSSLKLPTPYVQGEVDGVNPPSARATVPDQLSGSFEFVQLPGVGHFPRREAPAAVAEHLIRHFAR